MNLAQQLMNQAKKQGSRLFSIWHDQEMTYAQMEEAASKMAVGLVDQGIGKGDVVALLIPNVPPFLTSFFAIQKLGAVAVPINLLLKPAEVSHT